MKKEITFKSKDDLTTIHGIIWEPTEAPKGILQILHGMNGHIERYESTAAFFNKMGYIVCGHSSLGHGKSVVDKEHLGYFAKNDAPNILIDDALEMTFRVKEQYPDLPLTLLGYSFGSTIARNYLNKYSKELDGLILMGAPMHSNFKMNYALLHSSVVSFYKRGEFYRSKNIENLTTGSFKKYFKTKNKLAWMSKDEEYLADYANDPLVKFRFTINGYKTMFKLIKSANANFKTVENKNLPIMILSGKDDPVTNFGEAAIKLDKYLKNKKFTNVRYKTYNGLRHSLLNEVEKDIVLNDILFFLENINKKRG